jgi:hypothetical protein
MLLPFVRICSLKEEAWGYCHTHTFLLLPLDEQAKAINSQNLCDYIDAAPNDMLWQLISLICEDIGAKFSKERLRSELSECHWKYVVR